MTFEEILKNIKGEIPADAFIQTDSEGRTLLMRAAIEGDEEVVRSIIEKGYKDSEGEDDLLSSDPMTIINNLESTYDAITTISGDIDATDYSGMTALHYAAKEGNTQIVNILLEAGADPNIRTFSGKGYQDFLETETQSPQKEDEYSERENI